MQNIKTKPFKLYKYCQLFYYTIAGSWRDKCWPDNWTAVTVDGLLSAQFEQTLLVTDTGVDILTKRSVNNGLPYFMDKKS